MNPPLTGLRSVEFEGIGPACWLSAQVTVLPA